MISGPETWRLKLTVRVLRSGGVIACPTEGVWGLSCMPNDEAAVFRILELKQRSWKQGLILVASHIDQLAPWLAGLDDEQTAVLKESWPGPVTWLVPQVRQTPWWISGDSDKVALRVSDHPVISAVCQALGGPMVSTSANPAGKPAALSSLRVRQYFPEGIDFLVPGRLGGRQGASEIRDLTTGKVIRPPS